MENGGYAIYKASLNLLRNNLTDLFQQKQGRFQALDGLRAIAIIQVVLFHCLYLNYSTIPAVKREALLKQMSPWLNWIWQGDKGVDLFFVLSGFLITMLLLREHLNSGKVSITGFFTRRAGRIVPAYVLLLITGWLVAEPNHEYLWSNLLFINNITHPDSIYLPWSWSITVEVQFYLLFPIIALPAIIHSRRPFTVGVLIVLAALIARQAILYHNYNLVTIPFYEQVYDPVRFSAWWREIYIQLYTRAGPIAFGIAAAVIYTFYDDRLKAFIEKKPMVTKTTIVLALLISLFAHSVPYHDPTQNYLESIGISANFWLLAQHRNLYALCSAVILLFVLTPRGYFRSLHTILSSRILGFIAKISYSAYLFHILLLNTVFRQLRNLLPDNIGEPGWLLLGSVLTIAMTIAAASVIYLVVEKPFIDLTHKGHAK
ncbi:MAG: acyltransferase [Candidatus Thiodiazotropha sp. (ex Ctena orbiculata)]|nr:acyltransferase [Candidatus Thiodiazotropha taylori]MBT3036644.1 acyltransferase [Candidatus Thiodiazotropha taylori]